MASGSLLVPRGCCFPIWQHRYFYQEVYFSVLVHFSSEIYHNLTIIDYCNALLHSCFMFYPGLEQADRASAPRGDERLWVQHEAGPDR